MLTAVSLSHDEAGAKLAVYVPMLMREFGDDRAFTDESLHHVARQCRDGFPPYPVLCAHLSAWWRDNRPMPPKPLRLPAREAAPPPPREPPTAEEIAAVHEAVQQCVASLQASPLYREPPSRQLPDEARGAKPLCFPPHILDQLSPLPDGRKRTDVHARRAPTDHDAAQRETAA